MTAPLISVIVPTYNRAYCLPDAIESALGQTHANVEVVIVDDGSTDETEALVASRWAHEPRVRYVKQVNRGVAAARNTGLACCTGDFVALLDSDDHWMPWKLELQLACLAACPEAGMVWTDMEAVDPQGKQLHPTYLRTMYSAWDHFSVESLFASATPLEQVAPTLSDKVAGHTLYCGDIFSQMVLGNLVHTPTVLLRRERALKVSGFDETLCPAGEDYDFHLRTCREGPVAFIDMPTIEYQVGMSDALSRHGYSLSTNFLKIVNRTLEEDRAKVHLSAAQIDWVLADANAWVGQVLLDQGDGSGARQHLLTSLRHRPLELKVIKLLALALLPRGMRESIRASYGNLKAPSTDLRGDRGIRYVTRRRVLGLALAGMVLASAYVSGNSQSLAAPLLEADTKGPADAIVVLGSGTTPGCEPDVASAQRTALAAEMFREGRAPLVLLSGGPLGSSSCPVASAMADLAVHSGIPLRDIRVENLSADNDHQFERCDAILRTLGARRVLVVTSALEMALSDESFRRLGYDVERASVPLAAADTTYFGLLCARARHWLAAKRPGARQSAATVSAVADTNARDWRASGAPAHVDGPVVLVGTSYAHSWPMTSIADRPIINRGRPGQVTSEMLSHFDDDVLPVHPRAVIIWGFDNDLFNAPSGGVSAAVASIERAIGTMVDRATSQGIEPILETELTMRRPDGASEAFATLADSLLGRANYEDRINKEVLDLNSWLRELALRRHLLLLDVQPLLSDRSEQRLASFAKPDGVHITESGYEALTAYVAPILAQHFSGDAATAP